MVMTKRILLLISLLFFSISLISCAKKIPLTDTQKVYADKWVAVDSNFVHIYLNDNMEFVKM